MTCPSCKHNCDQGRYCPERIEREWFNLDRRVSWLYWALVATVACLIIGAIATVVL